MTRQLPLLRVDFVLQQSVAGTTQQEVSSCPFAFWLLQTPDVQDQQ